MILFTGLKAMKLQGWSTALQIQDLLVQTVALRNALALLMARWFGLRLLWRILISIKVRYGKSFSSDDRFDMLSTFRAERVLRPQRPWNLRSHRPFYLRLCGANWK